MTPFQKHVADWKNCQRCPLSLTRTQVVIARGSVPAQVLLIGEAPGISEDILGQPFIGPAGKLLDRMLEDAVKDSGKPRPSMAWTNLVGCMPREEDTKRKRGEPLPEEIAACKPRLDDFIKLCKPKLVVAVGLLSDKQAKAGNWGKVVTVQHPASILRADIGQKGLLIQRCILQLADAFGDL